VRRKGLLDIAYCRSSREDNDRNVAGVFSFLEDLAERQPIHAGHHHVQQDQVGQLRRGALKTELAVRLQEDFEPLLLKPESYRLDYILFIFDNQYPLAFGFA
jgi:hypothetical protein